MKLKKKVTVAKKAPKASAADKLAARLAELEKQNRILTKKLKKGGASVDLEAVAQQAAAEARKAAMKEGTSGMKKLQKKMELLEAENRKAKIKSIRARLMKQYGNRLIPALLVGETKDELEAAAVRSHKAWKSAVKGVGHVVDEEDEEDTEEEESDEDEEEEEDEEDEEDETPRRKPKATAGANRNGAQQTTFKKNQSRVALPEMPSINGRSGGLNKGGRNPRSLLNSVRTWTPAEYRERRGEVRAALRQAYPKQNV